MIRIRHDSSHIRPLPYGRSHSHRKASATAAAAAAVDDNSFTRCSGAACFTS